MKSIAQVLFCSILFLSMNYSYGITIQERFGERWQSEKTSSEVHLPVELQRTLLQRHIVFLPGILNELAKLTRVVGLGNSYFANNIEVIRELNGTYSLVNESSAKTIDENAKLLYQKIVGDKDTGDQGLYMEGNGKPLVLFAHSKGGAEALLLILRHPELILEGWIDRVILVEAAIGGSPLASQDELSWVMRMGSKLFQPGLDSLTPENARASFTRAFNYYGRFMKQFETDEERQAKSDFISKKIFYVRAETGPESMSFGIDLVHRVCGSSLSQFGRGDGLVLIGDQKLEGIGVDLGVIQSDHIGQTVSYFSSDRVYRMFSKQNMNEQKAFTRAVFAQVYDNNEIYECVESQFQTHLESKLK